MAIEFEIRVDDLTGDDIVALLRLHAESMLADSPPGTCHFLDLDGLRDPSVTVWSIWSADELAGCGALARLDTRHGEVKSMRTDPGHLGRGVGRAMLGHIVASSRDRGDTRLSLETGRGDSFTAAIHLYESFGFVECGPFGAYEPNDFSRYFTLELRPGATDVDRATTVPSAHRVGEIVGVNDGEALGRAGERDVQGAHPVLDVADDA